MSVFCRHFIVFDFSRTFRGVNTDFFFFNFSDIFLISPTSDPSDFLLNRAVRAVGSLFLVLASLKATLNIFDRCHVGVLFTFQK